jgi:hypothetical protein
VKIRLAFLELDGWTDGKTYMTKLARRFFWETGRNKTENVTPNIYVYTIRIV